MKKLLLIVLTLGILTSLSVIAGNSSENTSENVDTQPTVGSIGNAQDIPKAPSLESIGQTRKEITKDLAEINKQPTPPKELSANMNSIKNTQKQFVNSLNNDEKQLDETPIDKSLVEAGEKGANSLMKTENDKGQAVFNQQQIAPKEFAEAQANKNVTVIDQQETPPIKKLEKANQEGVDSGVDAYADSVDYKKQLDLLPPLKVPVKHEGIMQN